jgi:hypothetical protein
MLFPKIKTNLVLLLGLQLATSLSFHGRCSEQVASIAINMTWHNRQWKMKFDEIETLQLK